MSDLGDELFLSKHFQCLSEQLDELRKISFQQSELILVITRILDKLVPNQQRYNPANPTEHTTDVEFGRF